MRNYTAKRRSLCNDYKFPGVQVHRTVQFDPIFHNTLALRSWCKHNKPPVLICRSDCSCATFHFPGLDRRVREANKACTDSNAVLLTCSCFGECRSCYLTWLPGLLVHRCAETTLVRPTLQQWGWFCGYRKYSGLLGHSYVYDCQLLIPGLLLSLQYCLSFPQKYLDKLAFYTFDYFNLGYWHLHRCFAHKQPGEAMVGHFGVHRRLLIHLLDTIFDRAQFSVDLRMRKVYCGQAYCNLRQKGGRGQSTEFQKADDDREGWISCPVNRKIMKVPLLHTQGQQNKEF